MMRTMYNSTSRIERPTCYAILIAWSLSAIVSVANCQDREADDASKAIAESFWSASNPKLVSGPNRYFAVSDRLSSGIGKGRDVVLFDNGCVNIHDMVMIQGSLHVLSQVKSSSQELWSQDSQGAWARVPLKNPRHDIFLVDSVLDSAWQRVVSIGYDASDNDSDSLHGSGSIILSRLSGEEIGERFRFNSRPIDVSRDFYCRQIAVTTHSGELFMFSNRQNGLECDWFENAMVGPSPTVCQSVDGKHLVVSGPLGVRCISTRDRREVFFRPVQNKSSSACFVGTNIVVSFSDGDLEKYDLQSGEKGFNALFGVWG